MPLWVEQIENSFLSDDYKVQYEQLFADRIKRL
jgi:hypothetical protein